MLYHIKIYLIEYIIFFLVQREVEQQIQNLRTLFRQRLTEFPSSIDDQKLFIRYLHSLDPKADPAWDCIIHQKAALIDVLRSCAVDPKQQQQQQQQQSKIVYFLKKKKNFVMVKLNST